MSEQVVTSVVAQRIIVTFIADENVKPDEILTRLNTQFSDECLTIVIHLKKSGDRLKTCEDYTFCRESYGQRSFFGNLKASYSSSF
jgi:hypothetical protein